MVVEAIEAAAVEVVADKPTKPRRRPRRQRAGRGPNTQTCHRESGQGVIYIINTDAELIFVLSQQPAPGKTSLRHALHNETGTSPKVTKTQLT